MRPVSRWARLIAQGEEECYTPYTNVGLGAPTSSLCISTVPLIASLKKQLHLQHVGLPFTHTPQYLTSKGVWLTTLGGLRLPATEVAGFDATAGGVGVSKGLYFLTLPASTKDGVCTLEPCLCRICNSSLKRAACCSACSAGCMRRSLSCANRWSLASASLTTASFCLLRWSASSLAWWTACCCMLSLILTSDCICASLPLNASSNACWLVPACKLLQL